jgi:transcriptional regulator with XRE-family HTH domain
MEQQQEATFGAALWQALVQAGRSQAWLANSLHTNPSQVSRWVNGKAVPRIQTVAEIGNLLGVDLREAYRHSLRDAWSAEHGIADYELFVSTPIAELMGEEISAHRRAVARVVDVVQEVVGRDKLYWSGHGVASLNDLGAPDLATETSFKILANCRGYLFLQFAEMVDPSGALVELGFALGRKLKTTMIMKRNLRTPFMFEGLQGVAASLEFLPQVHMYVVDDVDEAVRLILRDGDRLLLPD